MMRLTLFAFVFSVFAAFHCANVNAADDQPATAAPAAQPATEAPTAPTQPIRVPDLSGDWCGSWSSCVNGHKGPMRASFCRQCDGSYRVTFVGRFAALIPFRYTTTLTPTSYSDGVVYLAGSQKLGPILGTFSYNAWANDHQFVSSFCSSNDQGQFTLSK